MRRIPNFVLLRAFEAAARLESFTPAANELHLTQSAISHQVKELEQYFGRPLFHRRNRRVETTSEGRRLHESLGRVFDVIEAACGEVALEPQAQVLAVHCAPSLAAQWLAPPLPELMQTNRMVTIRLSSDAEPADLARAREVDVGISIWLCARASGCNDACAGRGAHRAAMRAVALAKRHTGQGPDCKDDAHRFATKPCDMARLVRAEWAGDAARPTAFVRSRRIGDIRRGGWHGRGAGNDETRRARTDRAAICSNWARMSSRRSQGRRTVFLIASMSVTSKK